MSVKDKPHFEVASRDLAEWLMRQGPDLWWSVDGDPRLMRSLALPAPASELAEILTRVDKPLLIADPKNRPDSQGQMIGVERIDDVVQRFADELGDQTSKTPWLEDRVALMCWKDRGDNWLLIEDGETTETFQKAAEDFKNAATSHSEGR